MSLEEPFLKDAACAGSEDLGTWGGMREELGYDLGRDPVTDLVTDLVTDPGRDLGWDLVRWLHLV